MSVISEAVEGEFTNPLARQRRAWRCFDVLFAGGALIFAAPLLLLVALAIWIGDPGPIGFGQMRVGRGGRQFRCFKFRTMVVDAELRLAQLLRDDPEARREWERDHKLRRDPRITSVGALLRKSSLDELPQLLNVLRGEMSVVGPRPIIAAEIARYGADFRWYCFVKPGLTGLWQVSGRNDVSYNERVRLDAAYARSKSVMRDLGIIAATIPAVLLRRGSY